MSDMFDDVMEFRVGLTGPQPELEEPVKRCPKCGNTVIDNGNDKEFCYRDGTRLLSADFPCKKCGAILGPYNQFCEKCGEKVSNAS